MTCDRSHRGGGRADARPHTALAHRFEVFARGHAEAGLEATVEVREIPEARVVGDLRDPGFADRTAAAQVLSESSGSTRSRREGEVMHCPFCRHPDSRVVDSREADEGQAHEVDFQHVEDKARGISVDVETFGRIEEHIGRGFDSADIPAVVDVGLGKGGFGHLVTPFSVSSAPILPRNGKYGNENI
mgnify:CR=1 FL=1